MVEGTRSGLGKAEGSRPRALPHAGGRTANWPNPHHKIRRETCQLAKDQESLIERAALIYHAARPGARVSVDSLDRPPGVKGEAASAAGRGEERDREKRMRGPKRFDAKYQTAYSRKWSNEGRTIVALKKAGFAVIRFGATQRKKRRAFATDEPKTSGLIASDARRKSLAEFGKRMKPIDAVEVWTWPVMARQPEIERIA